MRYYQFPKADEVRIDGGFFGHYMDIMADKALPYQWKVLNGELDGNPTVRNFYIAAGLETGSFSGVPYQDTDLAKWIDAVGCSLAGRKNEELERTADKVISAIVKAQDPDGYLDTYYQLVCPEKKWTDPESHELYCFGHMIEAGISYYEGTGKRALLDAACRLADHVCRVFGPGENQIHGYRGHEIIEMALVRLASITGRKQYEQLAEYFITARRDHPDLFYQDSRREGNPLDYGCWGWGDPERESSSYEHVTGHAVRAMYLYSGMADVAREMNDPAMQNHCAELFRDVTESQMYVTGGIGTTSVLEAYTYPYDLPNGTMYAETCASIGLCFFAQRLLRFQNRSSYADVMERCLCNILPAAVAQDGKHYFYVNPLEVNEEACRKSPLKTHVKPVRQPWYECACCPPNLARMLLSLPRYLYSWAEDRINIHLYAQSEAKLCPGGREITIEQQTEYPLHGEVRLRVRCGVSAPLTVALRIPDWCSDYSVMLNGTIATGKMEDGYLLLERDWEGNAEIVLQMKMAPVWLRANRNVREDCGKAVISRGPVIYCIEEKDNGELLQDIEADYRVPLTETVRRDVDGFLRYTAVIACGSRSAEQSGHRNCLYYPLTEDRRTVSVTAIPYCIWGERTAGEMTVWINI